MHERMAEERRILLLDMNSYFASAEQQANPFLRGKPVLVSGDPSGRSVVSAASREAKKFGISSGMSLIDAYERCPQAVIVPLDADKYIDITERVVAILLSYTDLVEPWSIDEMCMDITGTITQRAGTEEQLAHEIKSRIQQAIGSWMTCSIGIAPNKTMAKIASNLKKPDGLTILYPPDILPTIDRLKLQDIYGIGRKIQERLSMIGIEDTRRLRACSQKKLIQEFGAWGYTLYLRIRGIDSSSVRTFYDASEQKSYSHATTLPSDSSSPELLFAALRKLSEKVARRLRKHHQRGRVVHVMVRFADFTTTGGQRALPRYTDDGLTIYRVARQLLERSFLDRGPIRLVGVAVTSLITNALQRSWLAADIQREAINAAIDKMEQRYGAGVIQPASTLLTRTLRKPHIDGFHYQRPDS